MKPERLKISWLLIFILLAGCESELFRQGNDEPLARVFDTYLYRTDVEDLVPQGTSAKDSISMVKNFINKWIEEQLLIRAAEESLTTEQKNFKKQLADYRNSLLIYTYESFLIHQNLDTLVTGEEILEYYELNKQNFELKENIVKVHFIILDKEPRRNNPIKRLLLSDALEDLDELEYFAKSDAYDYYLEDEWVTFSELIKRIPIETYNQVLFLQNNQYVELKDSVYYYFVRFLDFKIKESVSPLSLEKENIRNIILNKRKVDLIHSMRKQILQEAMNNNRFEIF